MNLNEKAEIEESSEDLPNLSEIKEKREIQKIERIFQEKYSERGFSKSFKISISRFLNQLHIQEVEKAMRIAVNCDKLRTPEDILKYFCGICWNQINNRLTLSIKNSDKNY